MTREQDRAAAPVTTTTEIEHVNAPRSNALFDALWAIAVRLNCEDEARGARDKPAAFDTVEDITNA